MNFILLVVSSHYKNIIKVRWNVILVNHGCMENEEHWEHVCMCSNHVGVDLCVCCLVPSAQFKDSSKYGRTKESENVQSDTDGSLHGVMCEAPSAVCVLRKEELITLPNNSACGPCK